MPCRKHVYLLFFAGSFEIIPHHFKEQSIRQKKKKLLRKQILLTCRFIFFSFPFLLSLKLKTRSNCTFSCTEETSKECFCIRKRYSWTYSVADSVITLPGPRNWHPRALTAAQRLAESCWGFWCCKISSVTVLSPSDRAALIARTRPSSSTSWQFTSVTSFLCIGRLSALWFKLATPTRKERKGKLLLFIRQINLNKANKNV